MKKGPVYLWIDNDTVKTIMVLQQRPIRSSLMGFVFFIFLFPNDATLVGAVFLTFCISSFSDKKNPRRWSFFEGDNGLNLTLRTTAT